VFGEFCGVESPHRSSNTVAGCAVDAAGKEMFAEAMAEGTLEAYFTLAAQFRTREFISALLTAKAVRGVELSAADE
jgi:hypothetical protein